MNNFILGYDDNLGLPSGFNEQVGCAIAAYHDLTLMLEAFVRNELSAIFIPAGTLPYLEEYTIVAQALFGTQKELTLATNFVTAEDIEITDLSTVIMGRVNRYCTTSFWAPLIYLQDVLAKHTALEFKDTDGFKDMLIKTTQKDLAGSMVWDIILEQNPTLASKVRQLFSKSDLPCPVICAKNNLPEPIMEKIFQFQTKDPKVLFNSFQQPNTALIQEFLRDIDSAAAHFDITLRAADETTKSYL